MVFIIDNDGEFWCHVFEIDDMKEGVECIAGPPLIHTPFVPLHLSLFALTLCYDYQSLVTVRLTIYLHHDHLESLPQMLIFWFHKPRELEFWGERLRHLHWKQAPRWPYAWITIFKFCHLLLLAPPHFNTILLTLLNSFNVLYFLLYISFPSSCPGFSVLSFEVSFAYCLSD